MSPEVRNLVLFAKSELACALTQALPTDDQIIIEHVRAAKATLDSLLEAA